MCLPKTLYKALGTRLRGPSRPIASSRLHVHPWGSASSADGCTGPAIFGHCSRHHIARLNNQLHCPPGSRSDGLPRRIDARSKRFSADPAADGLEQGRQYRRPPRAGPGDQGPDRGLGEGVWQPICSSTEVRTPAMQAGLAARKLFRKDVLSARVVPSRFAVVRSGSGEYHGQGGRLGCAA